MSQKNAHEDFLLWKIHFRIKTNFTKEKEKIATAVMKSIDFKMISICEFADLQILPKIFSRGTHHLRRRSVPLPTLRFLQTLNFRVAQQNFWSAKWTIYCSHSNSHVACNSAILLTSWCPANDFYMSPESLSPCEEESCLEHPIRMLDVLLCPRKYHVLQNVASVQFWFEFKSLITENE